VILDEASISRGAADQEHERQIAIYDLIDENSFGFAGPRRGSLWLKSPCRTAKLVLEIADGKRQSNHRTYSSLTPSGAFSRIIL